MAILSSPPRERLRAASERPVSATRPAIPEGCYQREVLRSRGARRPKGEESTPSLAPWADVERRNGRGSEGTVRHARPAGLGESPRASAARRHRVGFSHQDRHAGHRLDVRAQRRWSAQDSQVLQARHHNGSSVVVLDRGN